MTEHPRAPTLYSKTSKYNRVDIRVTRHGTLYHTSNKKQDEAAQRTSSSFLANVAQNTNREPQLVNIRSCQRLSLPGPFLRDLREAYPSTTQRQVYRCAEHTRACCHCSRHKRNTNADIPQRRKALPPVARAALPVSPRRRPRALTPLHCYRCRHCHRCSTLPVVRRRCCHSKRPCCWSGATPAPPPVR